MGVLVKSWLERLTKSGRQSRRVIIGQFERYVRDHGFSSLDELIAFQKKATGDERYKILDLTRGWIQTCGGTFGGMTELRDDSIVLSS